MSFFSALRKVKAMFNTPRDPKRIDPLLSEIRRVWVKNPDLRLGQLLVNAKIFETEDSSEHRGDLFNYEDDQLLKAIQSYDKPRHETEKAGSTKSTKKGMGKRKKGQVRKARHH